MEEASGSTSSLSAVVQNTASVSPIILHDESPVLEPMNADAKMLPRSYSQCDFEDLVELIARMLEQLIEINDEIPISPTTLTRFHSRASPSITVKDYLARIVRYSSLEKPTLLAAVFYIDLLSRSYPPFTLSSLTVHRFLITAVTVASKGLSDAFCTNTHYARIGGLGVHELNMLELEFLKKVDWKIVPEPAVLEAYYRSMISRDPRYGIESDVLPNRDTQAGDVEVDGVGGIKNSKHRGSMSDSVDERNSKLARTDNSSNDHPMTEQEDFIN